ncbi:hypothetical protein Q5P01_013674 [Channa striata]|uniref:Ig-like domain-containing protein n=1 Tax=Channa striata TaxID=64152 RepID=A0AA88MNC6_CHASR|nr:hypothetical protein Q5P01_013674 [Channa striata]
MRTLLGFLLVVAVSGGEGVTDKDEETFESILDGSVLLQCPCPNRDEKSDFRWQKEEPDVTLVFLSNSNFSEKYEGRAKIFVAQEKYNCSLLLNNITADDQGRYRCSFFSGGQYIRSFVNLNVYASYSICQKNPDTNRNESVKVFQCDVKGRYRDAEIQWSLDSQLLTNSSTTSIIHSHALGDSAGLYNFSSKLITEDRGISLPTCDVKVKGLSNRSLIISCESEPTQQAMHGTPEPVLCFKKYLKVIPFVLVIGLSLVLWCRWKRTQRLPKMRNVESVYFKC